MIHPCLPLLLVLPGWCLLPDRVPPRLRLPAVLAISLVVSTLTGLVLMPLGWCGPWQVLGLELVLLVRPLRRRSLVPIPLRPHLVALAATAVVATIAVATAGEPFAADGDAGVYTIAAAHLARTGAWTWPLAEVVPAGVDTELATRQVSYAYRWREVAPGFLVRGDRIVPQFLPAYPLWGAFAATGDHLSGPLGANLAGVLLLLVGLGELARRLGVGAGGWAVPVAAAASPLLLIFAKNPSAEVFLAGVLALWLVLAHRALQRPDPWWTVLAGSVLAVAVLVKFFAWAVVGVTGLVLVLQRPIRWRRAVTLLTPSAVAAVLALAVAGPHLANHLRQLTVLESFAAALAVAIGVVCVRLLPPAGRRAARWLLVAGALAAFAWLAWIRPVPVETGSENNLVEIARVIGWPVLGLAVVGWAWWTCSRRRPWQLLPAVIWVALTLYVAVGSGDTPWYPFAARRILPVTLPLGLLLAAALVGRVRRLGRAASGAVVLAAVLPALITQAGAVTARPGLGFRQALAELRAAAGGHELVLAFDRARPYAPYLLLLDQLPVVVADDEPGRQLRGLWRLAQRRPELVLLTGEWRSRATRIQEISVPRAGDVARTRMPPLTSEPAGETRLMVAHPSATERWLRPVLDVGRDDLLRVAGCFGPEAVDRRPARWTSDRALVIVGDGDAVRFVWSRGDRPDDAFRVRVAIDGREVGWAEVGRGWTTSRWFPLPTDRWHHLVEIRSPTFTPSAAGSRPGDHRELGVRLDRVEVRPRPPEAP